MTYWWLSTKGMTFAVGVDGAGIIRETPPIVRKFVGQPIDNLRGWLRKQEGYTEEIYR